MPDLIPAAAGRSGRVTVNVSTGFLLFHMALEYASDLGDELEPDDRAALDELAGKLDYQTDPLATLTNDQKLDLTMEQLRAVQPHRRWYTREVTRALDTKEPR